MSDRNEIKCPKCGRDMEPVLIDECITDDGITDEIFPFSNLRCEKCHTYLGTLDNMNRLKLEQLQTHILQILKKLGIEPDTD